MRPFTILIAIAATTAVIAQPVMPPCNVEDDFYARFGSNRNVELVAALLADKDFTVRENAVMDLGDMNNYTAVPHIRKAAADANPQVRAAAALAAAKFPADRAADIVTGLLADKDMTVQLAALRGVRMMKLTAAAEVRVLLEADRPVIQANALATLTALGRQPGLGEMDAFLDSPSAVVRQRAIENMMLWAAAEPGIDVDTPDGPPRDKLFALTQSGPSSLRATALAALGKYYGFVLSPDNGPEVLRLLGDAAKDKDPQIRLGAVQGFANAWQAHAITPFLTDDSEMVRLAAIRAVGKLASHKNAAEHPLKSADAVTPLFDLMLNAPLNELEAADTHQAARDALIALGTPAVAERAAKEFPGLVVRYRQLQDDSKASRDALATVANSGDKPAIRAAHAKVARISAQYRATYRNIRTCCRILGALKCDTVLDQQIALLDAEPTDSPVLGDLIWSLGAIGDSKALPSLETFMEKSVKLAREYLQAQLSMPPPYVPYSSEGTAQCVGALAKLNHPQWLAHAHALVTMKVQKLRLDRPVDEVLATYADRYATASADSKARMEAGVVDVISDDNHRRLARARSMRLAGQWKLPAAAAPLTAVLTTERPSRTMMQMAAWALYQIDGKDRPVGDPVVTSGGWVVMEK